MKKQTSIIAIMAGVVILGAIGVLLATQTSDRISSSAKKSYVFKTYLKNDNINIQVERDSIVTLTGTVSQWSHRSLAEETVAGLPGVTSVNNKLEYAGGQPAENSDSWIGIKVKTTLLFHRNLNGFTTEIDVKDGVVTLSGEASSIAHRDLATEYVNDIDGVKSVKNVMTVGKQKQEKSTGEKVSDLIDDASITAQVKLALMFHRSTMGIKTKVVTKDGAVTVSGTAKSGAEKDLVSKLVTDIKGVKEIKNLITIESVTLRTDAK